MSKWYVEYSRKINGLKATKFVEDIEADNEQDAIKYVKSHDEDCQKY